MKKMFRMIAAATVIFIALSAAFNIVTGRIFSRQQSDRNIAVNRINRSISDALAQSGEPPEDIISGSLESWRNEYGKKTPTDIRFIPVSEDSETVFYTDTDERCAVCSL